MQWIGLLSLIVKGAITLISVLGPACIVIAVVNLSHHPTEILALYWELQDTLDDMRLWFNRLPVRLYRLLSFDYYSLAILREKIRNGLYSDDL